MSVLSFMLFFKLNRAYELTNFNVKKQSENFPNFVGDDLFISLLSESEIKEVKNDQVSALHFNFINVKEIQSLEVASKFGLLPSLI